MSSVTVIYVPGMAGERWFDRRFVSAIAETGIPIRTHHWTHYWWPLRNLRNRKQHRQAEAELIDMVRATRAERPEDQIVLIGHSTGCLIVLEALERMDEPVDRVVLLSAAVRPNYDLTAALRNVRHLTHIGSPFDLILLGIGTTLCGTAEGCHRPSAGLVGFQGLGHDDPRFEERMFRVHWLKDHHYGGHIGPLHPRFAKDVVVPLIRRVES